MLFFLPFLGIFSILTLNTVETGSKRLSINSIIGEGRNGRNVGSKDINNLRGRTGYFKHKALMR